MTARPLALLLTGALATLAVQALRRASSRRPTTAAVRAAEPRRDLWGTPRCSEADLLDPGAVRALRRMPPR
jgi:hypothetical protein